MLNPGETRRVSFAGFMAWVTEPPAEKVVDGRRVFRVKMLVKPPEVNDLIPRSGGAITVTVATEPEAAVTTGTRVELVELHVQAYRFSSVGGGEYSGLSWRAVAVKPAAAIP